MKDPRSLLLILLSICIAGTWVYHIYDKNEYAKHPNIVYIREAPQPLADIAEPTTAFETTFANRSAGTVDEKMDAIRSLRKEIESMLADTGINEPGLKLVAEKIRELHHEMNTLGLETDSLLNQKEKTEGSVTEANTGQILESATTATSVVKKENSIPSKDPKDDPSMEGTFIASRVNLKAMNQYDKDQWQLTTDAKETNGLSVNFTVTNDNTSFKTTPVYIVLTDPKGNIVQDDLWEGGIISTKNSGIIRYTRRVNVEYSQGLQKKLALLIQLPEFNQGKYKIQIYHNNRMIGKSLLELH